jgi:hypothetical protein
MGRMKVVAALALAAVGACGGSPEADAVDQAENRACSELRNIAADYSDGIIGPTDLADRFPDVVRDARGTDLHAPAVEALAAAQRLDDAGIAAPLRRMVELCGDG